MKRIIAVLMVLLFSLGVASCDNSDDIGDRLENAGDEVQDAADEVGDNIEDAGDEVEDAVDDAGTF